MKKIIVLLSVYLLISGLTYSQKIADDKVPAPVKQTFAKKFPAATDVKYEMEKKDYEINFIENGVEMSANFDAKGNWLETETAIKETGLPKEVSASLAQNFKGFKISEIARVDKPENVLIYEMDLKKDKEGYEVQFKTNGEILNRKPLK